MGKTHVILILCSVFFVQVRCWLLNNIDYNVLVKSLDKEIANDATNPDKAALMKLALIYPGTKWCGMGNIADNYDDLGTEKETDLCCRNHDNCPDVILSGETKNNLTNDLFYTRLSCKCDEAFRRCLKTANAAASASIGHIYFDILQTKCYKRDYPVERCVKKGGWLYKKCIEYNFNKTAEKMFQWFDVKNFNDP